MTKKVKRPTVNFRIYKDSHEALKKHADTHKTTIVSLIYAFAMSLDTGKRTK